MSLRSRMRNVVTVYTADTSTPDRYGDEVLNFEGTEVRAFVEHESGDEDDQDRETRVTYFRAFFGSEVVLTAGDQVELEDGTMTEVWGRPAVRENHHGEHHTEARLRAEEG